MTTPATTTCELCPDCLRCPKCGSHRIAQTMQATIEYYVEYFHDVRGPDFSGVDIVEPVLQTDGAGSWPRYEIQGEWDSFGKIYCVDCEHYDVVSAFLWGDDEEAILPGC